MGFLSKVWKSASGQLDVFGKLRGGGRSHDDPLYLEYFPQNQQRYQPDMSGGGGFAGWLSSLPTPQQLAPMNGALRKTGVGPDLTPAMWQAFAPYGKSLIDKSAVEKMRGVTAGIAGGRREFEQQLLGAYQSSGVNPLFARASLAQSRPGVGSQIAQARAGVRSEQADETFNLMAALQNALTQSYETNRGLGVSSYFGGKGLEVSSKAAEIAGLTSGLSSLAALFGPKPG